MNRDRLALVGDRGYISAGRCSHRAQSYPQTLRVAVGALLRFLYWTPTDKSVASRPGASFSAVCPPDFTVPIFVMVSSLRPFQRRTTFVISTSAPSTEIFVFLMSSFHIFPSSALISAPGSVALITFSLSRNHLSALALPKASSKMAATTTTPVPRYPTFILLLSFLIPVTGDRLRLPLNRDAQRQDCLQFTTIILLLSLYPLLRDRFAHTP